MKRALSVWVLVLAMVVTTMAIAAGASQAPVRGGTLRFAVAVEPITLSPLMTGGDAPSAKPRLALFDPLFFVNYGEGKLVPGLATSIEKVSDTRWIVRLRKGVQFHKGYGEMTAEDVAFSYNEVVQKKLRSLFSLSGLKEARVINRYTVEFVLTMPYAAFQATSLTHLTMVVSKKAYQEMGMEKFNRNPVGTGPFQFVKWIPGNSIELKRFDKYWMKGLPYLNGIKFLIVPDPFVRANMLRTRQADVVQTPDLKDVAKLRTEKGIVVQAIVAHAWDGILFSYKMVKNGPLGDARVRRAIALALDRDQIVRDVYYGFAVPADTPTPPGFMGYPPNRVYGNKADIAAAKKLLADAGYPDGFETTLMAPNYQPMVRQAEVIASQLAQAGIRVKIEALDTGTYNSKLIGTNEFEIALQDVVIVSPDPDSPIYWFHRKGTQHWHGWEHPEIDALLDRGRGLTERKDREPIYWRVQDLIRQENSFIYTVHSINVQATLDSVQKLFLTPGAELSYSGTWLRR
ncbi:MAG: ABC transporter substrate-binding protein [bacterium]|jgi:peptide/nickel transport system substrate-binding protein|nr:ABC transporter substrate-binding protein [bacterium]